MNVHYTIATELCRQRHAQIAADVAACRRASKRQRRWWEPGFLRAMHVAEAASQGHIHITATP